MKKNAILGGLAIAATVGLFFYSLEATRYKSFVAGQMREADLFAEKLRRNLELALLDFELRARGLTTAIELSEELGQQRFALLADRFMKPNASILNLAVVEDASITLVHPYAENRHLVGRNLRDSPEQWAVLDRVQRTGEVAMQGPVRLLQDKRGLLVRMPVTAFDAHAGASGSTKVVSVVIDADTVFQEALQASLPANGAGSAFRAALTSAETGGETVGSPEVFSARPTAVSFPVPGTRLSLAVAPEGGWGAGYSVAWFTDLGMLSIIAVALFTLHVLRRQRAERDNVQSRLNAAIAALPDGFVFFDADDRLVVCNEKYKEFYKDSAAAMVPGARFEDILRYGLERGQYAEAVGREEDWLAGRMAAHRAADSTIEQHLGDGRWLRIFERQTPDGGRVGVRLDITELKQHQAELEASNANLRRALAERDRAERRFADVAELSKDWVWEMDQDLRFTYLSSTILADDPSFLIGKTREEAYQGHPEVFETADWDWLERKEQAHEPFRDFIYQAIGATDDNKWVRISGLPIFDDAGEFAGYRGVGSDISDVYNALRKAEAASAAKTEFLNVMSHELRTPLTVVLGYNALLAKPGVLPSVKALEGHVSGSDAVTPATARHVEAVKTEVARYAEKIEVAGKLLLTLINDILDLAKIEAGKLKVEPKEVSLDSVIASVADQLSDQARRESLQLRTETHGEIVLADEMRLRQILINLVGNALKFTERGHVTIRTELRGDEVAVHVEDSGAGIPKDQQELIFGEFDQIDGSSTREKGGTGLGLPISRHLVELQGGQLTLESEVGVGSIFTFTLPLAERHAKTDAA